MAPQKIPVEGDKDAWLAFWLGEQQEAQAEINRIVRERLGKLETRVERLYAIFWVLGPIASAIFGCIGAIFTALVINKLSK